MDAQGKHLVVSPQAETTLEWTPELLAQRDADEAQHTILAAARTEKQQRLGTLSGDAQVLDWIDKLAHSTNVQIDNYFANNVTTAAQAIAVLKGIVKVLAFKLR